MVVFNLDGDPEAFLNRGPKATKLTAYFEANALYPHARNYLYQEFPLHFVWIAADCRWKPRKQGTAIGRIYGASPSAGERFYLCLLLITIRGATSFDDFKSIDGEVMPTFKEACLRRGLLTDDGEWIQCLTEAVNMKTGHALCSLFAVMLQFCELTDPLALESVQGRFL